MSGTIPTPVITPTMTPDPSPPAHSTKETPIIAVVTELTFIFALATAGIMAWITKDNMFYGLFFTLAGAAGANANTVVQYYMGSSSSSARKDVTIATVATTPKGPTLS